MTSANYDRVHGMLLGGCTGDSLGAPYENGPVRLGLTIDGYSRGYYGTEPGHPTDDSDLLLINAGAQLSGDPAGRYVEDLIGWAQSGPPDIGTQTRRAVEYWLQGGPPQESEWAAGNGALMAVAPVAVVATSVIDARERGERFAAITHPNGASRYACGQMAALTYYLLQHGELPPVDLPPVPYGGGGAAGDHIGYCMLTLGVACAGLARVADGESAFDALVWVISLGGDTDTNACVAGTLMGAYLGEAQLRAHLPGWVLDGLQARRTCGHLARHLTGKR